MFRPWGQHLDALLIRAPVQNIDIDIAHAPALHFQSGGLVKINGAGPDQSSTVIVDHILLVCLHDFEPGSERESRPIGSGAAHNSPGKIFADGVASSAAAPLVDTIRRRAHIHAMRFFRAVAVRRWGLGCATREKCTEETCESKSQRCRLYLARR